MQENTQSPQADANKDLMRKARLALQNKQFKTAIQHCEDVLATTPDDRDALYLKAVCHRYDGQYGLARQALREIKILSPEYGRAYQEEGHIFRAQGKMDEAIHAYTQACTFNPGLEASWKAQAEILETQNRRTEANNARGFYERLVKLPRELHAVTNYLYEDELQKAEALCKRYLLGDKKNVEGMRLLAEIAKRMGADDEALFLYETAVELEPKNVMLGLDYINFLKKIEQIEKSYAHAEFLDATYPNSPMLQSTLAVQCLEIGEYERALTLLDQVLKEVPHDPVMRTLRGHVLKTYGRQDEAIDAYRQAFAVKPDHTESFFSLANLKTYRFLNSEIEKMEALLKTDSLPLQARANLCFSLGKAYEDIKDYAQAFSYYHQGNEHKLTQVRYKPEIMIGEVNAQKTIFTPAFIEQHAGTGHDASDPIFILGLPRAGSTMLEQIIASHSQVDGTKELPNILALAAQLSRRSKAKGGPGYPKILQDIAPEKFKEFGKTFIEETRIHRDGAPYFIDKMPNNFRHIGLIHLMLPNAKIIDARREPMACCFSGFKQLFAEGQEFTYGLTEVGLYYKSYVELMAHWDEVLPGKILRVHYEDVVADIEPQVRRVLDFCGLEFEEACVEFHKTDRAVRTASSEQVRQPINTKGLEQWRGFEEFLDPLKEALGDTLTSYRDR